MGSALDSASLIMYPSGYSDGVLGSAKPTDGSGDFTFTRGSNLSATRVGPNGYIEKGYENLLLQSNTFSDATWINQGSAYTITSGQAGYDGTNDAWLIDKSTTGSEYLRQFTSVSGVFTASIYAKAGTSNSVMIYSVGGYGTWDLSSGTFLSGGGNYISQSIDSVGNGWYRIQVTGNTTNLFYIQPKNSGASGAGSIYIQDAMLNQGLVAYPYIETTTAPVAGGILEDEPRIDFSDGCGHLLLEPSRTNLLPYSEYFGAWTTQSGITLAPNTDETTSPEGLNNAYKVVSTNASNGFYYTGLNSSAASIRSIYLKGAAGGETLYLKDPSGNGGFTSVTLTTEWQRFTHSTSNTGHIYQGLQIDDISLGTIYAYGAQWEEGSYPTSYIPTYGVSQTRLQELGRSGDYINTPITFGPTDDFAILYDGKIFEKDIMIIGGGTLDSNRLWIRNSEIRFDGTGATRMSTAHSSPQINTHFKLLVKRTGSTIKFFIDGSPVANTIHNPNTEFTINSLFWSLAFSYIAYGKHNQLTIFPTALSDDECIALTTI